MYFQRQDRLTARILTVKHQKMEEWISVMLRGFNLAAKDPKDPDCSISEIHGIETLGWPVSTYHCEIT